MAAAKPTKHDEATGKPEAPERAYHHGALRDALLEAAETLLRRDGIGGLSLRAAAREAGVSHAAPKNHFTDMRGLQSELAAVGFRRLGAAMRSATEEATTADDVMDAIGRAYVGFARANPGLFHLMYRSEMLDFARPALREAVADVSSSLQAAVTARQGAATAGPLDTVARITAAWSLVHGYATLLVDGRLNALLAHVSGDDKPATLLDAVLASVKKR